jgi:hypothetical protein
MRSRCEIYCDILSCGLLHIRNNSDDRQRCFEEADHLHNVPELLSNLDNEDLHRFYWNVMRKCFIERSKPEWLGRFKELWDELEQATVRETDPAGADIGLAGNTESGGEHGTYGRDPDANRPILTEQVDRNGPFFD